MSSTLVNDSPPLCVAYYCSGHGYGHATRVSAFARHLLTQQAPNLIIYLVSSAPERVFSDSIALGAQYRCADIDPVVVQPLAYRVDRRKSVQVLEQFLTTKNELLERERQWLLEIRAHCVLSDAAFLGCLAANAAGLPSILITNFTFDSVYSFLSSPILETPSILDIIPDTPIPHAEIAPLVDQILAGYRCADLLVRLPGYIPIPSFIVEPPLPSSNWIDVKSKRMKPEILERLLLPPSAMTVIQAPLLVRPHSPSVYTFEGRSKLLASIGIPPQSPDTKILIVSFGGQVFRRPNSSRGSRAHSRQSSRESLVDMTNRNDLLPSNGNGFLKPVEESVHDLHVATRLTTPDHLWIPGAPPVSRSPLVPSTSSFSIPIVNTIPPTPMESYSDEPGFPGLEVPQLLPDESWIAIICGASKEQWNAQDDEELPEGFFVAPKDVYMPDLTAVGDVLLGKLGYGTVSECVDTCTPFVYVSRPLFIEEHGLRLLLDQEGVGVELSRESYEAGDWTTAVNEAWTKGRDAKLRKVWEMQNAISVDKREKEGRRLAGTVTNWIESWWKRNGQVST
ncbi:hypothetical protein D9613_007850 [Agrocybe pediades]|uniref:Uncharacterized protein n=1 Tax=Agrocybe pediades TaxID=84607 RepID=A0A8H4QML5_9AGAR|nr:hypothetical protein D9613_007850 [Agrocybe pediades]